MTELNKPKLTVAQITTKDAPTWCAGCVLPNTIVHKNPSTDVIENIQIGDKVLALDGKYHEVYEVLKHRHQGEMFVIKSKCFGESVTTPEHPVLIVKREKFGHHNKTFLQEWTEAEKIKKGDYLIYPIPKTTEDLDEIELPLDKKLMNRKSKNLPHKISLTSDLLRVFGYYIAEGSAHNRHLNFTFNIKEKKYVEEIKTLFKKTFDLVATVKEIVEKSTLDVNIHHTPLIRVFEQWFGNGAQNKKISHFLMLLPKQKQKELIKGMWRGDGYVGRKKAGYKTISKLLTEQLKMLLLRQGIVPSISVNRAYKNHKQSYNIEITGKRNLERLASILEIKVGFDIQERYPRYVLTDNYVYMPVRSVETFNYNGLVYNLEVRDVQSYVTENAILHNCGDFTILSTLKMALVDLNVDTANTLIVSGIGCGSKLPHFVKTYGFEGLHGRSLPVATAAKLVNPNLNVIVVTGDGDGYGIGGNHFMHTMRRNLDICYIIEDNEVYGLTKGQASPTSEKGFRSPSTPAGVVEIPVNPLTWALVGGATYIARGYAMDIMHLRKLIVEGIKHKGLAIIDIFQPCTTYNKIQTPEWYKQRIYKLEEDKTYDPTNKVLAFQKMQEWGDKIPIGLLYKEDRPTYEDHVPQNTPIPVVEQDISNVDMSTLFSKFMQKAD
ncbi:MAG: hypothetical protein HY512_01805 [Candidatus Aenigmarchaeota archaeon]|nr:hypothetical protein [Candidatus Aenigmarchaeota archaeon]